ncbi:hypothetical protein D1007_18587 [Hordeum vulgare]|nr:hypothetical protein D1007_18587 [Hordeum vulgare]
MTVTLQDVSMITALPIEGKPLCMSTDSEGSRHQMEARIGMSPREPEAVDGGKKDRVLTDAPFTWIATSFANCPEDTNEDVIHTYACVYICYVISRTIFADRSGKNAQWMWLKALTVFDHKFSWGLATLAYLYRQAINCSYHLPEWVDMDAQLHRLDRRRQGKIKDWNKHHNKYVTMFELSVEEARSMPGTQLREHCPLAFNNYVRWFQENTQVDICPPAFDEDILEDPTSFDELAHGEYNKTIHKGYQTPFAPVLNFVDDMMLESFQRPAYLLKPRRGIKRYTPEDDANKGKKPVYGGSHMIEDVRRMRGMDNEDELEEPQPVVSKKLPTKRGRDHKTRGME